MRRPAFWFALLCVGAFTYLLHKTIYPPVVLFLATVATFLAGVTALGWALANRR